MPPKGLINMSVFMGLDLTQFQSGIQKVQRKLTSFGSKMDKIGKGLTLGVTAPIVGFGIASLKTAGDFEAAMNRVAAVSGATASELDGLSKIARKMGADTQFSAKESADALSFMAMAGLSVKEQMEGLPGVLKLAAAGNLEIAESADIATNIMSGYGKTAADLTTINDVLVKTFTSTNTNLTQLGEAFKFVGPIAKSLKVPFTETSAAIGLLGNIGIQASMAGTVLRGALTRLIRPPRMAAEAMKELGLNITESVINQEGLIGVIKRLEKSGASTAQIMKIFGQEAGPGMASLIEQGSAKLIDLNNNLINSGGVADAIAKKQMEGLNGALKRLGSAFEELQIAIANSGLLDFATSIVSKISGVIGKISSLNPAILKMGVIFGGLAAAIGPILVSLGAFASTILPALIGGFTLLTGPVGLVIAGIAALTTAAIALYKNWEQVTAFFNTGSGSKTFSKLKETVASAFESLKDIGAKLKSFFIGLWDEFGGVIQFTFINVLVGAADVVGHVFTAIAKNLDGFLKFLKGDIRGGFESFKEAWKEIGLAVARIVITMVDNILITLGKLVSYIPGVGETFQKGFGKAREALAGLTNKLFETTEELEKNTDKTKEGFEETTKEIDKTTSSIVAFGGAGAAALNKTQAAANSLKNTISEIAAATEKSLFGNSFNEDEQKILGKKSGFRLGEEASAGLSKQVGGFGGGFGTGIGGQIELGADDEEAVKGIGTPSEEDVETMREADKVSQGLSKSFEALEQSSVAMGGAFADSFISAADGAKSFADTIKDTIRGVIKSLIAKGIAAIVANTLGSAPGPIGIALAGAAGAAAGALFSSLIPKFEHGGMHKGGFRIVGERGPELEATGPARYTSNSDLQKMLGGGQSGPVKVDVKVSGTLRGEDIYLSGENYQRNVNRIA